MSWHIQIAFVIALKDLKFVNNVFVTVPYVRDALVQNNFMCYFLSKI